MKTNRLSAMAVLCEISQDRLEAFLDFVAEQEMTEPRISAAQFILGLPTPVLGWINQQTLKGEPSYGQARELLAQWRKRLEPGHAVDAHNPIQTATPDELAAQDEAWMQGALRAEAALLPPTVPGAHDRIRKIAADEMRGVYEALEEFARASRHFRMEPDNERNLERLVAAEQEAARILTSDDPSANDGAGGEGECHA